MDSQVHKPSLNCSSLKQRCNDCSPRVLQPKLVSSRLDAVGNWAMYCRTGFKVLYCRVPSPPHGTEIMPVRCDAAARCSKPLPSSAWTTRQATQSMARSSESWTAESTSCRSKQRWAERGPNQSQNLHAINKFDVARARGSHMTTVGTQLRPSLPKMST